MTSKKAHYTVLEHTADAGIRVTGRTLEDLFQNAGCSLMDIMIRKRRPVAKTSSVRMSVEGEDLADLMVRWLGEILYLFDGDHSVVVDIDVDVVTDNRIDAALHMVPFDPAHHEVATEIKAVTYHHIEVVPTQGGWRATVIFDL